MMPMSTDAPRPAAIAAAQALPLRGAGDAQGQAWRREMERAQLAAWFHDPVPAPSANPNVGTVARPAIIDAGMRPSLAVTGGGMPMPAVNPGMPTHWPQCDAASMQAAAPAANTEYENGRASAWHAWFFPPSAAMAINTSHGAAPGPARAHREAPLASMPSDIRQPIRLHAETDGDRVAVWIGMDPDSVASRLPVLLDHLRHTLSASGRRLSAVVCNGRAVWVATSGAAGEATHAAAAAGSAFLFNPFSSKEP